MSDLTGRRATVALFRQWNLAEDTPERDCACARAPHPRGVHWLTAAVDPPVGTTLVRLMRAHTRSDALIWSRRRGRRLPIDRGSSPSGMRGRSPRAVATAAAAAAAARRSSSSRWGADLRASYASEPKWFAVRAVEKRARERDGRGASLRTIPEDSSWQLGAGAVPSGAFVFGRSRPSGVRSMARGDVGRSASDGCLLLLSSTPEMADRTRRPNLGSRRGAFDFRKGGERSDRLASISVSPARTGVHPPQDGGHATMPMASSSMRIDPYLAEHRPVGAI